MKKLEAMLTKEEADKVVAEYKPPQNEFLNKYCPLIKECCTPECVCFVPSRLTLKYLRGERNPAAPSAPVSVGYTTKAWPPFCGNVMFIGFEP